MSSEALLSTPVEEQECDTPHTPSVSPIQIAMCGNTAPAPRMDDSDDASPYVYSEELAEQWAREDPDFHKETYKQDPYFDKEEQAELRRAMAEVEAGNFIEQVKVNGEWVEVNA